jgi:predicted nucleic acid-binding protein
LKFGETLLDWVVIKKAKDSLKQQLFELQIDKVESCAIGLALETSNSTIFLHDFKARKIALKLGINIKGTLGIIKAKLEGLMTTIIPILRRELHS